MNYYSLILNALGYKLKTAKDDLCNIQNEIVLSGLENYSTNKKWEIFNFHFDNNNFYKAYLKGNKYKKWNEIPELKKSDYQRPLPELISNGFNLKDLYIANTSGSTGTPFYFAKNKSAHALAWELIFDRYKKIGIYRNDLQARFYGIPLNGIGLVKEKIKDRIMNRLRFPVFDLSDNTLSIYVDRFKQNKFVYIYGYTNSIVHFSKYLINNKLVLKDLCNTLKAVIVTSEMCSETDKEIIEQGTGVKVSIEYGASEAGVIAIENENGEFLVSDELLYVENNEKGELLVTSFFNYAFPLIKYNIGDIGKVNYSYANSTIGAIQGRSDDLIKLPGGKLAAGLTLYYCSRDILEKSGKIKEIYITQTQLSSFNIYYISEFELTEKDKAIVQIAFDKYLLPNLDLTFIKTDIIRRRKNGKFQLFNSELN